MSQVDVFRDLLQELRWRIAYQFRDTEETIEDHGYNAGLNTALLYIAGLSELLDDFEDKE
jgi:hypothetical protein